MFSLISLLLCVYFLFAAAVQYNDPDPLHWMVLYLMSAYACVVSAMGKKKMALLYVLMGMAIIEMTITAEGLFTWIRSGNENLLTASMSEEKPYIELGREFLGAFISFAVTMWFWSRKPKKS